MAKTFLREILLGSAISLSAVTGATAQTARPTAENGYAIPEVVVTARRTEERLQDVPIAVTALTQKVFNQSGAFEVANLQTKVPGLATGANIGDRNNLTFTIRGQGQAYTTLFPAVIPYFAEVPISSLSTGQLFDLQSVQVLRGPQGVQFGRVTDGGNVMIAPQRPTREFDGEIAGRVGDYGLRGANGFLNIPANDKLGIRLAFDHAKRDGFTDNIYGGPALDSVGYTSGRIGVMFRPTERLQNYLVVQYAKTDDTGTSIELNAVNPIGLTNTAMVPFLLTTLGLSGAPVYGLNSRGEVLPYTAGLTPLSLSNYVAQVQSDLALQQALGIRKVAVTQPHYQQRKSLYAVNTTSYELTDKITLTNILGYTRAERHEAGLYQGGSSTIAQNCNSACGGLPVYSQEQFSDELRLAGKSFDDALTWSVGAYHDRQRPSENNISRATAIGFVDREVLGRAVTKSYAGYADGELDVSKWVHGLSFNAGVRYTNDTVQSENLDATRFVAAPNLQAELTASLAAIIGFDPVTAAAMAHAIANLQFPANGECAPYGAGTIFAANCINNSGNFHAVTGQLGATYHINNDQMAYLTVRRGYRPGGVNFSPPTRQQSMYSPEYDLSVEIGTKSDWRFGGMYARTNIALYHDNYSDIQQVTSVLTNGTQNAVVVNAAKAIVQGVEFEGTLIPIEGLTLGVNYAYTDAKFDKSITPGPGACDPAGFLTPTGPVHLGFCPLDRFPNVPEHQVDFTLDYGFNLGDGSRISFGGDVYHQSDVAMFALNYRQGAANINAPYTVVNLNAHWDHIGGGPIDAMIFATNVNNAEYKILANSHMGNGDLGVSSVSYGAPRMFGVSLTYRFGASARGK